MDLDLPAEDDPRRLEVRAWFERHPEPTPRQPVGRPGSSSLPWRSLGPRHGSRDSADHASRGRDEAGERHEAAEPVSASATAARPSWRWPNEEQQPRYLWPMLTGEELWCQLFSEPEAGSDLANLSVPVPSFDGDVYIVNGVRKRGRRSRRTLSSASSSRARASTYRPTSGISYFIVPMDLPGIEVRPILALWPTTACSATCSSPTAAAARRPT